MILFFPSLIHSDSLPFISPIFGDHMVLQRGREDRIWGWTSPGAKVSVTIAGKTTGSVADQTGRWLVAFDPPPPGGPYELRVDGPHVVNFKDVMVGDVWLCSGQSNMEFGLSMALNGAAEIAAADQPNLRLFLVNRKASTVPQPGPIGNWNVCTPETVATGGWGGFSAVAYFFGKSLQAKIGVPVGLVTADWGGMRGEAFVSSGALSALKDFAPTLKTIEESTRPNSPSESERLAKWYVLNDPVVPQWLDAPIDDSDWTPLPKLASNEALGLGIHKGSEFYSRTGVVWYRKQFQVPPDKVGKPTKLTLAWVGDHSSVWLNGEFLGDTIGASTVKHYEIPSGFRTGNNVLVVRVLTKNRWGGFFYYDKGQVGAEYADGSFLPLELDWSYRLGIELKSGTPLPTFFGEDPGLPSAIFNGMIAPLTPLSLKGIAWYQGEANVGRADQYRQILSTLISDWRGRFLKKDLPFLIVQLPNYLSRSPQPVDDSWADLREAQTDVARKMRHVGLAVTIDIGERSDIHPRNKQEVGRRLALIALRQVYGLPVADRGPTFRRARVEGAEVRLTFENADGLHLKGGADRAFAVAGADRRFQWAAARIDHDTVVVKCLSIPHPMFVKYAWDADPQAPLFNGEKLPAGPFRIQLDRPK